jgi:hypothetical protein
MTASLNRQSLLSVRALRLLSLKEDAPSPYPFNALVLTPLVLLSAPISASPFLRVKDLTLSFSASPYVCVALRCPVLARLFSPSK